MKTTKVLTIMLAGAMLAAAPLRAEEPATAPAKGMKCCSPQKEDDAKKPEMEKMKQDMAAKMNAMEVRKKAEAAEFDKLINEMNASTGDRKTEAMAAVINKMAQKQKEMSAKCDTMMKGMMKKDGKPEAKPAVLDYYTCKMHPAVHWPVPAKCPICAMDLVPVFKKDADAKAGDKTEAKSGEEPKKAADPHAGHH